jgi:hypothetical protein
MGRRSVGLLIPVLLCLAPHDANAQSEPRLSDLVSRLILEGITLPGGADPGSPHAGHFTLLNPTFGQSQPASIASQDAIRAVGAFNERYRSQLANFPLASSSGGFTWTTGKAAGVGVRRSNSFGPLFTERAQTIGARHFNLGFNFQYTSFDAFGGEGLDDGSIRFYLPHTDCCSAAAPPPSLLNPGFEGDLVEAALDLKISSQTYAFFATFGVTDKLDLGVAIPFSRVSLDATVNATILRLSTSTASTVHTFEQGQDVTTKSFGESGSAAGVGDITLRSKYNFLTNSTADLAVGIDLRLPTGDEQDLLGTGTTQAEIYLVASAPGDRWSPHMNVGFTISGSGNTDPEVGGAYEPLGMSHEFNYMGALEYIASPQLTLFGEVIGRTLFDAGRVEPDTLSFLFVRQGATAIERSDTNPVTGEPYSQLALRPGSLNLVLASGGLKFNVAPNLLISANALFPLTSGGLRDNFTIGFGFEYAF